jgi:hypothetical protein
MGSGTVIYVPSLIKIGSHVQKLIKGGYTDTHTHTQTNTHTRTATSSYKSTLFFKIWKVG